MILDDCFNQVRIQHRRITLTQQDADGCPAWGFNPPRRVGVVPGRTLSTFQAETSCLVKRTALRLRDNLSCYEQRKLRTHTGETDSPSSYPRRYCNVVVLLQILRRHACPVVDNQQLTQRFVYVKPDLSC